jgi:NAD(P)H-dependent FMN reductase
MNLTVFAASSSRSSINKKLAIHAASLLAKTSPEIVIEVLDLNDYELPLFSEDKEKELGQPDLAKQFLTKLGRSDALIISFAEHNGSYSAAYKNLFDWCSRLKPKVYQNKPMVLLATSPGPGGASSVLSAAVNSMGFFDGEVKGSFSLPSFYNNFDMENSRLSDRKLTAKLKQVVENLLT